LTGTFVLAFLDSILELFDFSPLLMGLIFAHKKMEDTKVSCSCYCFASVPLNYS
jgi:hypothetical protein